MKIKKFHENHKNDKNQHNVKEFPSHGFFLKQNFPFFKLNFKFFHSNFLSNFSNFLTIALIDSEKASDCQIAKFGVTQLSHNPPDLNKHNKNEIR